MRRGDNRGERRLRVARVVPELDYGGVETAVATQALVGHAPDIELEVVVFHRAGAVAERVRAAGVPVHVLGVAPAIRSPGATLALARLLRRMRVDVVHAAIAEANLHAVVASRLAGVRGVVTEEVGTPRRSARARALMGLVHRGATRTIACSQATATYLAAQERVPRERIDVVYNSWGTGALPRSSSDGPQGTQLLMVGRLVPEKDHATVIHAFAQLVQEDGAGGAALAIAGAGPLEPELRALVRRLGMVDRVRLLGYCSDVPELLRTAGVVLMPSTNEGYGIALVEAMAAGVPVISSTAGGLREVTAGYPSEWLLPPGDVPAWREAIRRFLRLDNAQRDALGVRARGIALERFSPEAYVAALERVYRAVAAGSPHAATLLKSSR